MSTIEDRCVDFRRLMCQLSKIDGRCVDLRRPMIDVKLCATLAQNIDGIL